MEKVTYQIEKAVAGCSEFSFYEDCDDREHGREMLDRLRKNSLKIHCAGAQPRFQLVKVTTKTEVESE